MARMPGMKHSGYTPVINKKNDKPLSKSAPLTPLERMLVVQTARAIDDPSTASDNQAIMDTAPTEETPTRKRRLESGAQRSRRLKLDQEVVDNEDSPSFGDLPCNDSPSSSVVSTRPAEPSSSKAPMSTSSKLAVSTSPEAPVSTSSKLSTPSSSKTPMSSSSKTPMSSSSKTPASTSSKTPMSSSSKTPASTSSFGALPCIDLTDEPESPVDPLPLQDEPMNDEDTDVEDTEDIFREMQSQEDADLLADLGEDCIRQEDINNLYGVADADEDIDEGSDIDTMIDDHVAEPGTTTSPPSREEAMATFLDAVPDQQTLAGLKPRTIINDFISDLQQPAVTQSAHLPNSTLGALPCWSFDDPTITPMWNELTSELSTAEPLWDLPTKLVAPSGRLDSALCLNLNYPPLKTGRVYPRFTTITDANHMKEQTMQVLGRKLGQLDDCLVFDGYPVRSPQQTEIKLLTYLTPTVQAACKKLYQRLVSSASYKVRLVFRQDQLNMYTNHRPNSQALPCYGTFTIYGRSYKAYAEFLGSDPCKVSSLVIPIYHPSYFFRSTLRSSNRIMDELVNAACAMTSRLIVQPWLFKSMRHTSVGLRGRSRQGVRHLGDARGELSKAATFEESIAYWNIRSASYPNGYFHDLRLSALYLAVEARTGITIPLAVLPRRLRCYIEEDVPLGLLPCIVPQDVHDAVLLDEARVEDGTPTFVEAIRKAIESSFGNQREMVADDVQRRISKYGGTFADHAAQSIKNVRTFLSRKDQLGTGRVEIDLRLSDVFTRNLISANTFLTLPDSAKRTQKGYNIAASLRRGATKQFLDTTHIEIYKERLDVWTKGGPEALISWLLPKISDLHYFKVPQNLQHRLPSRPPSGSDTL